MSSNSCHFSNKCILKVIKRIISTISKSQNVDFHASKIGKHFWKFGPTVPGTFLINISNFLYSIPIMTVITYTYICIQRERVELDNNTEHDGASVWSDSGCNSSVTTESITEADFLDNYQDFKVIIKNFLLQVFFYST